MDPGGESYAINLSSGEFNMSPGTWYKFAFVRDGTDIIIYINGIERNRGNGYVGPIPSATGLIGIGDNFDGSIDDVRVYNRALSQPEIANLP